MRIVMLLRCLSMMHGGGETRHLAWAEALRRGRDEVTIITGRPLLASPRYETEPPTIVLRSPYVREIVYRHQHTRGLGRALSQLLHADEEWFCRAAWSRIARMNPRPDVVHAHALYQAARLRRDRVPTVINLPGEPHARYLSDLRAADALVADGWAADALPSLLGRDVDHVPKGVDADRFHPDGANLRNQLGLVNRRVALVVSRLVPIKNVALAVDALAAASTRQPALTMVVVGDGPQRPMLEQRAAALNVSDRLTFVGAQPHAQLPMWYRSADLFVLSSTFDNSPNVVLEAMASGLPVVSTDVGGVRQYVADGVNGSLVRSGDVTAMAEAILRYSGDAATARQVGDRNRHDTVARFTWAASASVLRSVYDRVVERRQREQGFRATA